MAYGNGYRAKAKQEWVRGAVVSVGFVRDLYVEGKEDGAYLLHSLTNGRKYLFTPHLGLEAL